jgi:hypothetical protein
LFAVRGSGEGDALVSELVKDYLLGKLAGC